jgi:hypothetical protein
MSEHPLWCLFAVACLREVDRRKKIFKRRRVSDIQVQTGDQPGLAPTEQKALRGEIASEIRDRLRQAREELGSDEERAAFDFWLQIELDIDLLDSSTTNPATLNAPDAKRQFSWSQRALWNHLAGNNPNIMTLAQCKQIFERVQKVVQKHFYSLLPTDSLFRISSIDRKIAKKLMKRGICSLRDLAKLSVEEAAKLLHEIGLRGNLAKEDWPQKARRLLDLPNH